MAKADGAGRWFFLYLGISLTTLTLLMLEINVTRLLSVVMFYHFSFLAISMALFGLSASGVLAYLFSDRLAPDRAAGRMSAWAILFSGSIFASFMFFKLFPFEAELTVESFARLFLLCLVWTLPFFLGGMCIALALRSYSRRISNLYFADLSGAALGCLVIVVLMEKFGSPTAVPIIAATAALAAAFFAVFERRKQVVGVAVVGISILFCVAGFAYRDNILKVVSKREMALGKKGINPTLVFSKWNSLSRVDVFTWTPVGGWGMSKAYDGPLTEMLGVQIDAAAATPLIRFTGDLRRIEFLKFDVTQVAHFLKKSPDVFVIGPGGGRDILSALLFGAKSIHAADINSLIVDIVGKYFADFAGRIYELANVNVVVDDARSYLRRAREKFDIIHSSMTDTWAATVAGAFSLTENNLYTREAFDEYWRRLRDDGIISFSRYMSSPPRETLRVVSLALSCLEDQNIKNPSRHIAVIACHPVATTLLKKSPFTKKEIAVLKSVARALRYKIVYLPGYPGNAVFRRLIEAKDRSRFYEEYPFDVSPPTDDRPFFFNMLKLRHLFGWLKDEPGGNHNLYAQLSLIFLLAVYLLLFVCLIILPLYFRTSRQHRLTRSVLSKLMFFAAIGLGFMLVEISIMAKMSLFLGHPTYALVVVLFSLLLFSGIGSVLTARVAEGRARLHLGLSGVAVILVLSAYVLLSGQVFERFVFASLGYRFLVCAGLLLPLGLLMGRLFPLGIKSLGNDGQFLVPWAWALNGLTSVLGSILAVIVGIWAGFAACLILGILSYGAALLFASVKLKLA